MLMIIINISDNTLFIQYVSTLYKPNLNKLSLNYKKSSIFRNLHILHLIFHTTSKLTTNSAHNSTNAIIHVFLGSKNIDLSRSKAVFKSNFVFSFFGLFLATAIFAFLNFRKWSGRCRIFVANHSKLRRESERDRIYHEGIRRRVKIDKTIKMAVGGVVVQFAALLQLLLVIICDGQVMLRYRQCTYFGKFFILIFVYDILLNFALDLSGSCQAVLLLWNCKVHNQSITLL